MLNPVYFCCVSGCVSISVRLCLKSKSSSYTDYRAFGDNNESGSDPEPLRTATPTIIRTISTDIATDWHFPKAAYESIEIRTALSHLSKVEMCSSQNANYFYDKITTEVR